MLVVLYFDKLSTRSRQFFVILKCAVCTWLFRKKQPVGKHTNIMQVKRIKVELKPGIYHAAYYPYDSLKCEDYNTIFSKIKKVDTAGIATLRDQSVFFAVYYDPDDKEDRDEEEEEDSPHAFALIPLDLCKKDEEEDHSSCWNFEFDKVTTVYAVRYPDHWLIQLENGRFHLSSSGISSEKFIPSDDEGEISC